VVVPDAEMPPTKPAEITERAADAGREVPPPASAPAAPLAREAVAAAPKPAASKPAAASAPAPSSDGARAQALLDGQPASAAGAARVVVQVGAYTEPTKLKEARQKVEQLGFKTYTQVIEVDGTKRTRVRVGPFATKAEADKAAARIKASGLPVAILAL
jgi:DedD protein